MLENSEWVLRENQFAKHPRVKIANGATVNSEDFDGVVLRVPRLTESKCPAPDIELLEWLEPGWEVFGNSVTKLQSKNITDADGNTVTVAFKDDANRVSKLESWLFTRNSWLEAEAPTRTVNDLYHQLFALDAKIRKESEKYQLFLGNGCLKWNSPLGPIDHPLFLRKLELQVDPSVPECRIIETDDDPFLYSALLRLQPHVEGKALVEIREKLSNDSLNLLDASRANGFFQFAIQRLFSNGIFVDSDDNRPIGTVPTMSGDIAFFLGPSTQGFAEAIDRLIDAIPTKEDISAALFRVVGVETSSLSNQISLASGNDGEPQADLDQIDCLLTKPANQEQERIIERLERTGAVLVQGPPGTGKSHTIANLIGHCLAQGKTILVSSHTAKALKVVREKVVPSLQPLCVSLLDNAQESKSQLEESINGIVSYLSRADQQQLQSEISALKKQRDGLNGLSSTLKTNIVQARKDEYIDIVVGGEAISPQSAAKYLAEQEEAHGWIPSPLTPNAALNLSIEEINWLYQSNELISKDEENCLDENMPSVDEIATPAQFAALSNDLERLLSTGCDKFKSLWNSDNQKLTDLDDIIHLLTKSSKTLIQETWLTKVFEDVNLSAGHVIPWTSLIEQITESAKEIADGSEQIFKYGPEVEDGNDELLNLAADEIVIHFRGGKKIGLFSFFGKAHWKQLITSSNISGKPPSTIEHFIAIKAFLRTRQLRRSLESRWNRQVLALGGKSLHPITPEKEALVIADSIKFVIRWKSVIWKEIETKLQAAGFELNLAIAESTPDLHTGNKLDQILTLIQKTLVPATTERRLWLQKEALLQTESALRNALDAHRGKPNINRLIIVPLESAIQLRDTKKYEETYSALLQCTSKYELRNKRKLLIERLGLLACSWASAIAERSARHTNSEPPTDPGTAWKVAQYRQELNRRHSVDYGKLQNDLRKVMRDLEECNAQYVEKLSWLFQLKRTGLKERQALNGWKDLQKRLTKSGRGVRDEIIRKQSRETLKDCKTSVPVWIMPLSKVFESYDLATTKFDVLILDEASQSDIRTLAAFAIADQIVVVGDNEQVTPYAVGQNLLSVQSLIEEMLFDVPNRTLYDGRTSIYDIAAQSFGETIRLVEHFRCVPSIIEFSNALSYNGEIKPLREASSSPFSEHLITHRVASANSSGKTNKVEALEIASLVSAMTSLPEYSKSSIGVISLVGQEQAIYIDSLLQRKLDPSAYSKFKILCGNASQFQGDERDVVILSMVDSCDEPPLHIRQSDDFKKAYNVSVSRARDQLWLVHSLNPQTDLKPGDLRLRLHSHIENPFSLQNTVGKLLKKAESPFENEVIRFLVNAGFRLKPQWEVGAYRIDIVAEGVSKRIAIECDGEKYHAADKTAEDTARQMVLERLGWRFIRIRGSEFYRNREKCMTRVIQELDDFGIERLGAEISEKSDSKSISELKNKVTALASEFRARWNQSE
jgi:very-short-patch-repair endonuclease